MEQFGSSSAHNPKVGGSNPPPAIHSFKFNRSRSVAVNTPACHAGDRGFDSVETAIIITITVQ